MSIGQLAAELEPYVLSKHDFVVGKCLGSGGFSKVYAAVRVSTRQVCAIKVLKYKNLKGDKFTLYEREIKILAKCQHPFIMGFVGFTAEPPYAICTEYIRNGSLWHILRDRHSKPLTGTQKTLIALGIAQGVMRLHQLNIIHRDLKSLNVLLDKYMLPKVCDFGLSRFSNDESAEFFTVRVGTCQWMAPELVVGVPYNEKVDVYSYGMILWELLTGKAPFMGWNEIELARAVVHEGKRPDIPAKTPEKLASLITACWSADPNDRPSMSDIVKLWMTKKVKFPGTEFKEVEKMIGLVSAGKTKEKIRVDKELKLPKHLRVEHPDDIFLLKEASNPTKTQVKLPEPGSSTFRDDFEAAVAHVCLKNAESFYARIREYFEKNVSNEELAIILSSIISLFEKDRQFLVIFADKDMHESLPLTGVAVNEIATVLLYLFTYHTARFSEELLTKILGLTQFIPLQVLRFMNIYVTTRPVLPHVRLMQKSILANADFFIGIGYAMAVAQIIYTFCLFDKDFKEKFALEIAQVFEHCLATERVDCCAYILKILVEEPWEVNNLTNILAGSLMHVETNQLAMAVCSKRYKTLACDRGLARALLSNGQNSKTATYILMAGCERQDIAVMLADLGNLWLHLRLPSFRMTAKLLMRVLAFPETREIVAKSANLFSLLLQIVADAKGIEAIPAITNQLPIDETFVNQASTTGFLQAYYRRVFTIQKPQMMGVCLKITERFVHFAFLNEYCLLFDWMRQLLKDENRRGTVVSLLYTLSKNPQAKQKLFEYRFHEYLLQYQNEPNLSACITRCIQNIQTPE